LQFKEDLDRTPPLGQATNCRELVIQLSPFGRFVNTHILRQTQDHWCQKLSETLFIPTDSDALLLRYDKQSKLLRQGLQQAAQLLPLELWM